MNREQSDRLHTLAETVFEAVALDCNPAHWTGYGKRPNQLDAKERGDAVWCRKQALSTLVLYERLKALAAGASPQTPDPDAGEEDPMAKTIAEYEGKAAAMLDRLGIPRTPAKGR